VTNDRIHTHVFGVTVGQQLPHGPGACPLTKGRPLVLHACRIPVVWATVCAGGLAC
jgi:hypothetical protein